MTYSIALAATLAAGLVTQAEDVTATGGRILASGTQQVLKVTNIDHDSRRVTLMGVDGLERTFVAGEQVRNLAQVDVGDRVTIVESEIMAVRVFPVDSGAKGRITRTEVARAPLGAKPYGSITRRVEITAKLVELDRESRSATLEGKHGSLTLRVKQDVDLSKIEVGDSVFVDYMERLTISVDGPAK